MIFFLIINQFQIFIFVSSQIESIREFISKNQLQNRRKNSNDELSNFNIIILFEIIFVAFVTRKSKNKTRSFSSIDKKNCIQKNKIDKSNYKKMNNKNKINNVYQIKQIFKSHIHIMRILNVFNNDENFDLNYTFESINYRKIRNSSF